MSLLIFWLSLTASPLYLGYPRVNGCDPADNYSNVASGRSLKVTGLGDTEVEFHNLPEDGALTSCVTSAQGAEVSFAVDLGQTYTINNTLIFVKKGHLLQSDSLQLHIGHACCGADAYPSTCSTQCPVPQLESVPSAVTDPEAYRLTCQGYGDVAGNYVRVVLSNSFLLPVSVCKIQVIGCHILQDDNENVALGKATDQSSTRYDGLAVYAVDGSLEQHYKTGNRTWCTRTCSNSSEAPLPHWWQVDLTDPVLVSRLVIYDRVCGVCEDRLVNFTIQLGQAAENGSTAVQYVDCFYHQGYPSSDIVFINCSQQVCGRYVRVVKQLSDLSALTLCEFQVFGTVLQTPFSRLPVTTQASSISTADTMGWTTAGVTSDPLTSTPGSYQAASDSTRATDSLITSSSSMTGATTTTASNSTQSTIQSFSTPGRDIVATESEILLETTHLNISSHSSTSTTSRPITPEATSSSGKTKPSTGLHAPTTHDWTSATTSSLQTDNVSTSSPGPLVNTEQAHTVHPTTNTSVPQLTSLAPLAPSTTTPCGRCRCVRQEKISPPAGQDRSHRERQRVAAEVARQINSALAVDPAATSMSQRRRICAPDARLVSRTSGFLAATLLVFVVAAMVCLDLSSCVSRGSPSPGHRV